MRFLAILLLALALILPGHARAQDDSTFLSRFLQDNLSDAGRTVTVTGFEGALSSQASIKELTIADEDGVWLTARNIVLNWNRLALVRGRVEVTELTAESITITRAPVMAEDAPSPEAQGFSLPELPVSVNIGNFRIGRIELGEPLFGFAAVVSAAGSASLAGGEGNANLTVERIDGTAGRMALRGGFSNSTRQLDIDFALEEGPGGIVATLIGLPEKPALSLTVAGSGIIDDFTAQIQLATADHNNLTGNVKLRSEPSPVAEGQPPLPPTWYFDMDLGGDLRPLLPPDLRDFFGPQMNIVAEGKRAPDGWTNVPHFALTTQAMTLGGGFTIGTDGFPDRIDVKGNITPPPGATRVVLPFGRPRTSVTGATLALDYDRVSGRSWHFNADLQDALRGADAIGTLSLEGSGEILHPYDDDTLRVDGRLRIGADAIALADPALARAVGPWLNGRLDFYWQQGEDGFRIPHMSLNGEDYSLTTDLKLEGLSSALRITGTGTVAMADAGRFSDLAGRPLAGAASADVSGLYEPLSGVLDVDATVRGQGLSLGQDQADRLLAGESTVALSLRRDETGTTLRKLDVAAQTLTASASGKITTGAVDVTAQLSFSDLSVLGGSFGGAFDTTAVVVSEGKAVRLTLDGQARNLAIGQPMVDPILRGQSTLGINARMDEDGTLRLERLAFANPQLTVNANGVAESGQRRLTIDARLANLAVIAPGYPGPLTVQGDIIDRDGQLNVDLNARGPAQIQGRVNGTVARDFSTSNLTITGTGQLGIINAAISPRSVQGPVRFDLRMQGAPGVQALSGTVSASNVRFVEPATSVNISGGQVQVTLNNGTANVQADARFDQGGTVAVRGTVGLTTPFNADLTAVLSGARLRDPDLYDTTANGTIRIAGPLAGGAAITGTLDLGTTELRIPSSGFGGTWPIPDMSHVREPSDVRATRARAGLIETGQAGPARRPFPLDLTINAPNRVFLRGRGVDAEFGGTIRLGGTTANVIPAGQFTLIRGRIDFLDRRFDMTRGNIQVQGSFIPYVDMAASTTVNGVTAIVTVEGDVSEPEIHFTSSPQMPEEEVLSNILFGRDLSSLSPIQAAQLASAVATLAGHGGEGIVSRLRKGFGLDNLDVITDAQGNAAVRAGRYLSENVYTEVVVGSRNQTQINLNLDVSPSVTVRGSLREDGNTGLGVFYERDY